MNKTTAIIIFLVLLALGTVNCQQSGGTGEKGVSPMEEVDEWAPHSAETIFVIAAGITGLILDSSFITFSKDVERVWKIALDPYKFPPITQMHLKYLLTALVVLRTFTVHITIALYVVMLWPAIFAEREYLLIPWIVVGTIRVCANVVATLTGLYICSKYGILSTLWIEFLLVQLLNHGPFLYIWLNILSYRSFLLEVEEERKREMEQDIYLIKLRRKSRQQVTAARRRAMDDKRDSISHTTITTIIQRLSDRKKEQMSTRSLDTLLEIIDKGYHNEETNSINSATATSNNTDSNMQSVLKQKLQITDEEIDQAKKNKSYNSDDSSYQLIDIRYIRDGSLDSSTFEQSGSDKEMDNVSSGTTTTENESNKSETIEQS